MTVEVHPDVKALIELSAKYDEQNRKLASAMLALAWELHKALMNNVHEPARAA